MELASYQALSSISSLLSVSQYSCIYSIVSFMRLNGLGLSLLQGSSLSAVLCSYYIRNLIISSIGALSLIIFLLPLFSFCWL